MTRRAQNSISAKSRRICGKRPKNTVKKLLEAVAEGDDALMEKFFAGEEITKEEI